MKKTQTILIYKIFKEHKIVYEILQKETNKIFKKNVHVWKNERHTKNLKQEKKYLKNRMG